MTKRVAVETVVPPHHLRIREIVASIPRGCVTSYGDVAERAGMARGARLVGRVLRESPDAVALPWHRVLRADGRLAFPAGSRAFREQARRLRAEGVSVVRGRIDLASKGWRHDLDAEIWGFSDPADEPSRKRRTR